MAVDFSRLTNTDLSTTPFQYVVFGKNGGLLEVELNEAQLLSYERQRSIVKLLGNMCSDPSMFNYDESTSTLTISSGILALNGYIINLSESVSVSDITEGNKVYATISLETLDKDSIVKKFGVSSEESIDNTIEDTRVGIETTRRESLKLEFSTTESEDSVLLGEILGGTFTTHLICTNVSKRLQEIEEAINNATICGNISGLNPQIGNSTNAPLVYGKFSGYTKQNETPTPDEPQDIHCLGDSGYFDGEWVQGQCSNGEIVDDPNYICTNIIDYYCREGDKITVNYSGICDKISIFYYDKHGNYTTGSTNNSSSLSDTIRREKRNRFRIQVYNSNGVSISEAGHLSIVINSKYAIPVKTTNEAGTEKSTTIIPITSPLYEGDYLEIYTDGSGKISRTNGKIDSYAGEEIITDYVSTTGELSEGATVVYKLETPVEEPLTPEQIAEFKKLYTFKNVTNVICDGEVALRYYVNNYNGDSVGKVHNDIKKSVNSIKLTDEDLNTL